MKIEVKFNKISCTKMKIILINLIFNNSSNSNIKINNYCNRINKIKIILTNNKKIIIITIIIITTTIIIKNQIQIKTKKILKKDKKKKKNKKKIKIALYFELFFKN